MDTASAQFPAEVTRLAQSIVAQGDRVYGASCVGVGKGSAKWSEEELKALELGVVGGFARGCHAGGITRFALLSAAGSTAKSRIRYVRVMGLKEETVQGIGFKRLSIFRPGIIAGNAHTPSYVACLARLESFRRPVNLTALDQPKSAAACSVVSVGRFAHCVPSIEESTRLPSHGLLHFKRRQIDPVDPCVSLKAFHHVLR